MSLMRDEVGQHMAYVEGQVAPYIPSRRRDLPPGLKAQLQQCCDAVAAVLQGSHELPPCDTTLIHASRRGNAVFPPQRLDPSAPRVVQMSCDHSDRAPWRSGNRRVPECGWQALDELDRDRLFVCHAASSVARRSGGDGKPGLSPSNGPPATRTSPARCTPLRSAHEPSRPRTRPEYPVGSSPHESETCPRWSRCPPRGIHSAAGC